ncbi:hypothetical protein OH76DRAFT_550278 [Lentinus brumalis]|uniref:Uncharacterized protein n=1 Tax=Lentinus brumalis TaxID=2498619 RepID=A0A371D9Y7_9APHY|nr:hypothetical protein OH76DRAFT_550278 [Polyporus brumalis]
MVRSPFVLENTEASLASSDDTQSCLVPSTREAKRRKDRGAKYSSHGRPARTSGLSESPRLSFGLWSCSVCQFELQPTRLCIRLSRTGAVSDVVARTGRVHCGRRISNISRMFPVLER